MSTPPKKDNSVHRLRSGAWYQSPTDKIFSPTSKQLMNRRKKNAMNSIAPKNLFKAKGSSLKPEELKESAELAKTPKKPRKPQPSKKPKESSIPEEASTPSTPTKTPHKEQPTTPM
eukprot:TRINITY_DN43443_c0_g1_i1.p1 TRINITY_DN43443_c0_g1~~TRINITY_DN43443_c0_g1_i1.p1  ORF type:complete len:116 (+),score=18.09 TRINITY_DN43443_c0_g1_i1:58-405(+)